VLSDISIALVELEQREFGRPAPRLRAVIHDNADDEDIGDFEMSPLETCLV
jgi:hypothetical protein